MSEALLKQNKEVLQSYRVGQNVVLHPLNQMTIIEIV